jgi:hypothetical protein
VLFLVDPVAPGYAVVPAGPCPLGSILVVALNESPLIDIAAATRVAGANRWVPLVLAGVVKERTAAAALLGTGSWPLGLGWMPGEALPKAWEVMDVVRQQPRPTPSAVAEFVHHRCGANCGESVKTVLSGGPISHRIRRLLRLHGSLSPHGWSRVVVLLQFLGEAARSPGLSQEAVALRHEATSRSLSMWTHKLMGMGWRAAVSLGSWEARLEAVLRQGCYVTDALPFAASEDYRSRAACS